ncbi:hypothetical protein PCORN_09667 [Listeria cornellensis FSL F6-0969]|uniref:Uncharacterized protein n=1 Tax=Listeria cornellensis FSL F6-0969 TaxID=1265820 RepID=W7BRS2_9LIST|nr:hypothetical protein PCORN_09667 [Listeria cornellensis FSL F6-0969]
MILLKLFHVDGRIMETIQSRGINWGVTVITVAILIPIATGQIGFKDLIDSFKSAAGWIGLLAGIAVSILAKKGRRLYGGRPTSDGFTCFWYDFSCGTIPWGCGRTSHCSRNCLCAYARCSFI